MNSYRPWVPGGTAAGFGQRDEAFDHFIEQGGLLEIEHVARFRKDRQSGRRQVLLQEQARLDAIIVLVAADDQGGRRHFSDFLGERVDLGGRRLITTKSNGLTLGIVSVEKAKRN